MKTTHKFWFLKYALCLLLVQSTLQAFAQTTKPLVKAKKVVIKNGLGVSQQFRNDTVRLRWMPIEATQWILNNQRGYFVERGEVVKGQKVLFKKLTEKPILPARKDAKTQSEEEYVGLKSIHEESIQTSLDDKLGEDVANQLLLRHLVGTMTAFKSFGAAQKMGLGFTDVGVQKNKRYVYRVFPNLVRVKGEPPIDTTYALVNTSKNAAQKLPPMLDKEELEKSVFITWPARNYLKEFILYHIEKSEDGTNFKRVSTSPIMYSNSKLKIAYFKDSLTQNYRPYLYRLVGMTPFGEWITSQMPIMAMGRDKTPPAQPIIESAKHVGGSKVEIKWKMPASEGDLKGFWIGRASGVSSKYNKITTSLLPKSTTKITDFKADLTGTNHYMVYAVDTSGNERASFPTYVALTDSLPPASPKGLVAKATTDKEKKIGIVTITWRNNKEKDLQGYYVYFANDPDHEFSQITKRMLSDSVFRDTITLKSLTKNVFYKVVAVDKHFNISNFSEVTMAKRPDIIKPIAPLITNIKIKDNTATIDWQRSPSNDVIEYRLYRREQTKSWVKVKTFQGKELSNRRFIDNLQTDNVYEYYVEVADESGLISEPSPIKTARRPRLLVLADSPEPTITYNEESKQNLITWKYKGKGFYKIAVYRAEGKGGYRILGFAGLDDSQFIDRRLQIGDFKYALKAIHDNGQESRFSEPVMVKIE
jgi:uncharacterized protein